MNGYELTRQWYNFKFENVGKVTHIHSDLYFYIIDLWNRLGQKKEFGLPTMVTMECVGIKSYNTYKKAIDDLITFGFIKEVKKSVNQYNSRVIALSKIDKALNKALDKALTNTTDKALDSIIEQRTINKEYIDFYREIKHLTLTQEDFKKLEVDYTKEQIDSVLDSIENYKKNSQYTSLYLTAKNWLGRDYKKKTETSTKIVICR